MQGNLTQCIDISPNAFTPIHLGVVRIAQRIAKYLFAHPCADQLQLSLQFSSGQFKPIQDMEISR